MHFSSPKIVRIIQLVSNKISVGFVQDRFIQLR